MLPFQYVSGSVAGRRHTGGLTVFVGGSNQDEELVHLESDLLVAVVTDGCSTGAAIDNPEDLRGSRNEVGARLGAVQLVKLLTGLARASPGQSISTEMLSHVEISMKTWISSYVEMNFGAAEVLGAERWDATLLDYMLFNSVCMIMAPERTTFLGDGDGVYGINGEVTRLPRFDENAPSYCAQQLFRGRSVPSRAGYRVYREVPTSQLRSAWIGTDGANELLDAERRFIPGTAITVGSVADPMERPDLFLKPNALTRFLRRLNREVVVIDPLEGRLVRTEGIIQDDIALCMVRRAEVPNA